MASTPDPKPLIGPSDMQVVEAVLDMGSGYVLDFSDRTFDQFIAHEIGIDATADRYSKDGGSKAKRLRSILHSLSAGQQATLLRAMLKHRDSPVRADRMQILSPALRRSYVELIERLDRQVERANNLYSASSWTGRRTVREQVEIVRGLAPVALREIDLLASIVEDKRFNDPDTVDAISCLRDLHQQLGQLLTAVDHGRLTRAAVEAIEANRKNLIRLLGEGAKLAVVAPTMTLGLVHILASLTGVPVDSTMVSTTFTAVVGADALRALSKKSSLAK